MAAGRGILLEQAGSNLQQEAGWGYAPDRAVLIDYDRAQLIATAVQGQDVAAVSNKQKIRTEAL